MSFNILLKTQLERLVGYIKDSLDNKQNTLTASNGISISNNLISTKLGIGLQFDESQRIKVNPSRIAEISYVKEVVRPGNYLALSNFSITENGLTYTTNGSHIVFSGIVPEGGWQMPLVSDLQLQAGTYTFLTTSVNTIHELSLNSVFLKIIIDRVGQTRQVINVTSSEYSLILDNQASIEVDICSIEGYDFSNTSGIFYVSCTRIFGSSNIPDSAALITPTEFENLD